MNAPVQPQQVVYNNGGYDNGGYPPGPEKDGYPPYSLVSLLFFPPPVDTRDLIHCNAERHATSQFTRFSGVGTEYSPATIHPRSKLPGTSRPISRIMQDAVGKICGEFLESGQTDTRPVFLWVFLSTVIAGRRTICMA